MSQKIDETTPPWEVDMDPSFAKEWPELTVRLPPVLAQFVISEAGRTGNSTSGVIFNFVRSIRRQLIDARRLPPEEKV
jgi:hypothetical protein